MTEVDKAYIAGIVDGEGCITIERRSKGRTKPIHTVCVCIANTDLSLINWIKAKIGGCLATKSVPKDKNWNTQYQLQIRGVAAVEVLISILPYLRSKLEQALTALEMKALLVGTGAFVDSQNYLKRESLYLRIRSLNVRGKGRYFQPERASEKNSDIRVGICGAPNLQE